FQFTDTGNTLARNATEQAFSIWKALGDSLIVCTIASLLSLLLGSFLAYSISRFAVGGRYFRYMILTIRMVPPIVIAIPLLMYYAIMIPYATESVLGVRVSLFDTRIGIGLL